MKEYIKEQTEERPSVSSNSILSHLTDNTNEMNIMNMIYSEVESLGRGLSGLDSYLERENKAMEESFLKKQQQETKKGRVSVNLSDYSYSSFGSGFTGSLAKVSVNDDITME